MRSLTSGDRLVYPQQPYNDAQAGYGPPPPQPSVPPGPRTGYGQPGQMPPPPGMFLQDPDKMPGTAVTVRVLMFIGGGLGVLGALAMGLIGVLGVGLGQLAGGMAQDADAAMGGNIIGAIAFLVAMIPLTYAVVSFVLAAKMGKRSSGIFWGIIVFQILAAAFLVFHAVLAETFWNSIPLVFAVLMITLMFLPAGRAYYRV